MSARGHAATALRFGAEPGFAHLLAFSAVLHVLTAFSLFAFGALRSRPVWRVEPLTVELIALAAPASPAAALAPAPSVREKILLPKTPNAAAESFEEQAKAPEEAPPQSLEELLATLAGERPDVLPRASNAPVTSAAAPLGASGEARSLEMRRWALAVKAHMKKHWKLTPGLAHLSAYAEVTLDAAGHVGAVRVSPGSGNFSFDRSVEQAFLRASPLPAPPEPGVQVFKMDPQDL